MTALIPRPRSSARFPGFVAHHGIRTGSSPASAKARTRTASITTGNIGESPPWPGPRIVASGRPVPSQTWGSWCLARRGSAQRHGPKVQQTLSCNLGGRPVARGRFVPCCWARLMAESTGTVQSICPAASASARNLPWIRSHVPSEANRR
jgi:hypothetical protein